MVEDRKRLVIGKMLDYTSRLARDNPKVDWSASTAKLKAAESELEDQIAQYVIGKADLKALTPYVRKWGAAVVENRRG